MIALVTVAVVWGVFMAVFVYAVWKMKRRQTTYTSADLIGNAYIGTPPVSTKVADSTQVPVDPPETAASDFEVRF